MSFPFGNRKKKHILVLDIGTAAVKSLVAEEKGNETIVLGGAVEYLDPGHDLYRIETLKKIILRSAITTQDKTGIVPKAAILSLPADILKTNISQQNYQRKFSKKNIGPEEKNIIYQKVLRQSQEETAQIFFQATGISPSDIIFIDFKILEMKIDGYPVSSLLDLSGRKIDITFLLAYLPKYIEKYGNCDFEFFKKTIENLGWKIEKTVFPLQNLISANPENDVIFLDVGGFITQIILIENKKLKRINDIDFGGENFSQALSFNLGIGLERARILKHEYSQKVLSEPTRERIRKIIEPDLQKWFNMVKRKLAEKNSLLPRNIILMGGGSMLPEIPEILATGDWNGVRFFDKIKIKCLRPKDLNLTTEEFIDNCNTLQFTPSLLFCGSESLTFKLNHA